jgi:hypothetical protein
MSFPEVLDCTMCAKLDDRYSSSPCKPDCVCVANEDPITLDLICKLIIEYTHLCNTEYFAMDADEKKAVGICLQKLYWLEPCGSNFWLSVLIHYERRATVAPDHFAQFIEL